MADGSFIPRRVREQTEREESLRAALLAVMEHGQDTAELLDEMRKLVVSFCELAGQESARAVAAERCLESATDAIAAFLARHDADPGGALLALRAWVEALS